MRTIIYCLFIYFIFSFYQVYALMAYSPKQKLIVAAEKGSNTIWYKSLIENDRQWKKVNGLDHGKAGFNQIIYSGDKFIAIADYATIWYSFDGKNWKIAEGLTGQTVFNAIIHTKWGYMVVGRGWKHGIWSSNDGITWRDRVKRIFYLDLSAIAFDGDRTLVAVGNGQVVYSFNTGLNLHSLKVNAKFNDVTYGKDKFVAVGDKISYSRDGKEWISVIYNGARLHKIKYAASINQFIAVGEHAQIWYSSDGVSWLRAIVDQNEVNDATLTFLDVSSENYFVAGGQGNKSMFYSFGESQAWHSPITCIDIKCNSDPSFKNFDSLIRLDNGKYFTLTSPVENFNTYVALKGFDWRMSGSLIFKGTVNPPNSLFLGNNHSRSIGITISPDGKHIYVTNPVHSIWWRWYINWYEINSKDGSLIYKGNIQPNEEPAGIAISRDGNYLYLNTWKGLIIAYHVAADGSLSLLGPLNQRDQNEYARGIIISPDGKFIYSYGEKITWYKVNEDGTLTVKGSMNFKYEGIETLSISSDGHTAYATFLQGRISVFSIRPDGSLVFLKRYQENFINYSLVTSPYDKTLYSIEEKSRYQNPLLIRELKINPANDSLQLGPSTRAPQKEDSTQQGIGPVGLTIAQNAKILYSASNSGRVHWFEISE